MLIVALIVPLALVTAILRRRSPEEASRRDLDVLLATPFAPSEHSGGSKAVGDLQRGLAQRLRVAIWTVPERIVDKSVGAKLSRLLTRALPIPTQCRALAFGHAQMRHESARARVVLFEFFATAVALFLGRVDSPRVVIRDHEVLLRKLAMEYEGERGMRKCVALIRVATCWLLSAVVYTRADAIVALTLEDRDSIQHAFPWCASRTSCIPAPFDPPAAVPLLPVVSPVRDLLMVANFFHTPNVDGLIWFLRECAPHLQTPFTLHLCGLDRPLDAIDLSTDKIVVHRHGFVADTAAVSKLAPIAIAPIVSGGGVRIKNLFLGSLGKALLTTPLGNEGIGFVDGEHALVCADAHGWARRLDELAQNAEFVNSLGRRAQAHVRAAFEQDAILGQIHQVVCPQTN